MSNDNDVHNKRVPIDYHVFHVNLYRCLTSHQEELFVTTDFLLF